MRQMLKNVSIFTLFLTILFIIFPASFSYAEEDVKEKIIEFLNGTFESINAQGVKGKVEIRSRN